jgi:molybdopterin synthase catalytic subunit
VQWDNEWGSLIVHRCGRLEPGEDIILVATLAQHRQAAFEACHFLIDWLKTKGAVLEKQGG